MIQRVDIHLKDWNKAITDRPNPVLKDLEFLHTLIIHRKTFKYIRLPNFHGTQDPQFYLFFEEGIKSVFKEGFHVHIDLEGDAKFGSFRDADLVILNSVPNKIIIYKNIQVGTT